jgi:hypothetical protein
MEHTHTGEPGLATFPESRCSCHSLVPYYQSVIATLRVVIGYHSADPKSTIFGSPFPCFSPISRREMLCGHAGPRLFGKLPGDFMKTKHHPERGRGWERDSSIRPQAS